MCEIGENEYELTADRARRQESTMSAISLFLETEKGSQESKEFGREETPSQNLFEYFS